MMGIYIKGMEMPKSCADCPIGDTLCCSLMPGVPALWKEYTLAIRTNRRHEECPLVHVPPHGRLVDADEIIRRIEFTMRYYVVKDKFDKGRVAGWKNAIMAIREYAPTVIPAEEEV